MQPLLPFYCRLDNVCLRLFVFLPICCLLIFFGLFSVCRSLPGLELAFGFVLKSATSPRSDPIFTLNLVLYLYRIRFHSCCSRQWRLFNPLQLARFEVTACGPSGRGQTCFLLASDTRLGISEEHSCLFKLLLPVSAFCLHHLRQWMPWLRRRLGLRGLSISLCGVHLREKGATRQVSIISLPSRFMIIPSDPAACAIRLCLHVVLFTGPESLELHSKSGISCSPFVVTFQSASRPSLEIKIRKCYLLKLGKTPSRSSRPQPRNQQLLTAHSLLPSPHPPPHLPFIAVSSAFGLRRDSSSDLLKTLTAQNLPQES